MNYRFLIIWRELETHPKIYIFRRIKIPWQVLHFAFSEEVFLSQLLHLALPDPLQ